VEVDPLASMRCWAIELELGGRTFDVPALSAVDWWPLLSSGDHGQILDFVVSSPTDPDSLDELLLDGRIDPEEVRVAAVDAIEAAAGRSLHVATVLVQLANAQWSSINGALVRHGFRWEGQPFGAVLDAVYAEVTARTDEEGRKKLDAILADESLTQPRSGKRKVSPQAVSDFEAMAGPRPGSASAGRSADSQPRTLTPPRSRPRPGRSGGPKRRPAAPGGNAPAASSGSLPGEAPPASA